MTSKGEILHILTLSSSFSLSLQWRSSMKSLFIYTIFSTTQRAQTARPLLPSPEAHTLLCIVEIVFFTPREQKGSFE